MNKKAIFINTASQIFVRFATLIFTLISIKLLTNYLGPAGVGNYNTITTYVNFFIVIADLGLFSVAVREISLKPESERKILSNIFTIRLISCIIAALVSGIIIFSTHYPYELKIGTVFGIGFLFFNLLSSIYDMALQYRLKMQFSALAEFLSKLITLVALYLIIRSHGNFIWITSTIALSGLIVFLLKWLFTERFISFLPKYDKAIAKWIFSMAWPLGLVFIVNNLFFKLDSLLLFVIKGSAAVGIYSVAYKILEVTAFIAGYFSSSLKPTISKNIKENSDYLAGIITKAIIVLLILVVPISAISIAFSKEIILFLSNKEFLPGAEALIVLSLTLPFIYLDTLMGEILIAQDSRKLLLRISVFLVLFNLIANLIAIPRYSFMGAAYTTLISEIMLLVINIYYIKKTVKFKFEAINLVKILLLFLLTLLFGYFIKITGLYFIISILITGAFFALLCQMLGVVNLKSIKSLISS